MGSWYFATDSGVDAKKFLFFYFSKSGLNHKMLSLLIWNICLMEDAFTKPVDKEVNTRWGRHRLYTTLHQQGWRPETVVPKFFRGIRHYLPTGYLRTECLFHLEFYWQFGNLCTRLLAVLEGFQNFNLRNVIWCYMMQPTQRSPGNIMYVFHEYLCFIA